VLLQQIQRRLTSEDSRHFRSLAELRRLQKQRAAASPPAQQIEKAPVTENWVRSVKPPAAPAAFPPGSVQSGPGASAGQCQAAPNVSPGLTERASQ
jgi:anti-sigma factor RsiW